MKQTVRNMSLKLNSSDVKALEELQMWYGQPYASLIRMALYNLRDSVRILGNASAKMAEGKANGKNQI